MFSRRRIRVALIGLLLLVLIAWLVREIIGVGDPAPHPGSLPGANSDSGIVLTLAN